MLIKGIIDEDFVNYKRPCMVIEFPFCTFKCDKECGKQVCQNSTLAKLENTDIKPVYIVARYIFNDITQAVVAQGLEPMDSWEDLLKLISEFRKQTNDDFVIYTGYTKEELQNMGYIDVLKKFSNIIIKFGRYIPNQESHYDEILGINLASNNQFAEKIS